MMIFQDRTDAGRRLATKLAKYVDRSDVIVLALPRGGVPVGFEVAHQLGAPLDIFLVRKLGVPGRDELAMGAIASGGVRVLNEDVVHELGIDERWINMVATKELAELRRREEAYRDGRTAPVVRDKTVILVDDGLATGATMRAAVAALRQMGPSCIVVAVPVGASQTCDELRGLADEVVCFQEPNPFYAVGTWYRDFGQTTDDEVRELLGLANGAPHTMAS
jgi:putative phosphoribosyl transferase